MSGPLPGQPVVSELDVTLLAAAVDTGSLGGAARAAGLAPPVARRRLARLERCVGVPLVTGGYGAIGLTGAGRAVLAAARGYLAAVADAIRQVCGASGPPGAQDAPRLRLATFGRNWDAFADDLTRYLPGVVLHLHGGEPDQAADLFDRYCADVLYTWLVPDDPVGLTRRATVVPILDEPLWVALPAGHRCAARPAVPLAQLRAERWVVAATDRSRRLLAAVGAAADFAPDVGYVVESAASARSLVGNGHGVALAAPLLHPPDPAAGMVIRPLAASPRRRHVLAVDPAAAPERLAHALRSWLRASYAASAARSHPAYRNSPEFPLAEPDTVPEPPDPALSRGLCGARVSGLNLADLRLIQAVGECGSLNRAARVLLVSQPALSRQTKRLERRLGTALFVRSHRGTVLAPAGYQLLAALSAAEAAFQDALAAARGAA